MTARVGVLGASGAVGRELVRILEERALPVAELVLFARRDGVAQFRGVDVPIRPPELAALRELDLLFSCAGADAARDWLPRVRGGPFVVDNSSAFRADPGIPLVVPEINGEVLAGADMVANPNCSTIILLMAAAPLHRRFELRTLIVATYQAASGAGAEGLAELRTGTVGYLADAEPAPTVFSAPIAFNLIPEIGSHVIGGATAEEEKIRNESRRILERPDLDVEATCVRVAVMRAHSVAATATFARPVELEVARAELARAPGLRALEVPNPRDQSGRDDVAVGRLRASALDPRRASFFAVGDQLRKGAALNAVQLAELAGFGAR